MSLWVVTHHSLTPQKFPSPSMFFTLVPENRGVHNDQADMKDGKLAGSWEMDTKLETAPGKWDHKYVASRKHVKGLWSVENYWSVPKSWHRSIRKTKIFIFNWRKQDNCLRSFHCIFLLELYVSCSILWEENSDPDNLVFTQFYFWGMNNAI